MGWFNDFIHNAASGIGESLDAKARLKGEQVDRLDANTKIGIMNAKQQIESKKAQDKMIQSIIIISGLLIFFDYYQKHKK